jgi:hypothetical protein
LFSEAGPSQQVSLRTFTPAFSPPGGDDRSGLSSPSLCRDTLVGNYLGWGANAESRDMGMTTVGNLEHFDLSLPHMEDVV